MQIEPRLLGQNQGAKVFQVLFADRLAQLDLLERFALVDNRLQDVVDSVAVSHHVQAVELVEPHLVAFAFNLGFVFFDVDDLGLDRLGVVELAELNDAPQFVADVFEVVRR